MCAILGILGNLPDKETFIKARDTMTHRGPDDAGLYYEPKEGLALGHRRLSIIDLTDAGHQPFFSYDGRYVIVYNGEIYNYKELKKELAPHYPFKTNTDTEVLLAAYMHWGKDCLRRLNGMFAFAIWDKHTKTLFCVRDRLGIKPFYWSVHNGNFYCASEIKGILSVTDIPRKLNKQGVLDYLSYRYPLGDKTFFEGINALLPGHFLLVKKGEKPDQRQYWELPVVAEKEDPGERTVLEETEKLLKETVKSHMISDVPLGAYLSGGLDSSTLVAFMAQLSDKPIKTFSVGFHEKGFNEFEHARTVARFLKTDHHEIILSGEDYLGLLPRVIKYKDAPLHVPNEVPLYALSRELKKHITVVLSGEGADELFGGYGRIFRSGYDFERILAVKHRDSKQSFGHEKARFSELGVEQQETLVHNLKEKCGDVLPNNPIDHFLYQYSYIKRKQKDELLNPGYFQRYKTDILNKAYFLPHFERVKKLSTTEQYIWIFQKIHLLGLLHRLDTPTMAASVEGRVPFVDHKLVEYVSSLPLRYKMAWRSARDRKSASLLNSDQISETHDITKCLLRSIGSRYLPQSITNRRKVGFPVPLDAWFCGSLNQYAKEVLLSSHACSQSLYNKRILEEVLCSDKVSFSKGFGLYIWMLVNIELWMREYNIKT